MAKTKLIPGFRFHPTEVELVKYFLKRKVMGKKFPVQVIAEVDIYKYAPWDLPDKSLLRTEDMEWYFFCPKGKKYAVGPRMNRSNEVGYWKTTGRDRPICHNNQIVGMMKTLVFHLGRPPKGDRTNWVMHEFRLQDRDLADKGIAQDSNVLCRVFKKDGPGPREGGVQHGKLFKEEKWDDYYEEDEISGQDSASNIAELVPVPILPIVGGGCFGSSSMSPFSSSGVTHPSVSSTSDVSDQVPINDDVSCTEEEEEANIVVLNGDNNLETVDNCDKKKDAEGIELDDIFEDLEDLNTLGGLGEDEHDNGVEYTYTTNHMLFTAYMHHPHQHFHWQGFPPDR